ncbi:MAG: Gldg family protein [Phycisphaerae bacterium]
MAVTRNAQSAAASNPAQGGKDFKGRHLVIGANVAISIVVATAIVALVQWAAYYKYAKADLTDQGVNSLTPGTERLIGGLDRKVHLTSMYFQTDLEEEDQAKYRLKVNDLLGLYQSVNRSMIEYQHFNPLQDHAKREQFVDRLYNLKKFKEQVEPYRELIERFGAELLGRVGELVETELSEIRALQQAIMGENEKDNLGQIQYVLQRWQREVEHVTRDLDEALNVPQPRYGAAKTTVTSLASNFVRDLNNIISFAKQIVGRGPEMSPPMADYVSGVSGRYQSLIEDLEKVEAEARELPQLEFEQLLRQIGPTANALVVETDEDAKVISFNDIWPTVDPGMPSRAAGFAHRLFKGEEKLTSAVLQLTQEERSAVMFVRFGGPSAFFSLPGGRPAQYAKLREVLEDANFEVQEWDVSSSDNPPEIDPPPTRTIYVVLRPTAPPRNPFNQARQQPQFGEQHKQKVLDQLGENPRAIFLAGWAPGPFGSFPDLYPYDSYLNDNWGVHVASDSLLLKAFPSDRAGEFALHQRSLFQSQFARSDHLIVKGMRGQPGTFPYVSPLEIASEPPEGVSIERLLWFERTESLWGIKDVQKYIEQARRMRGVRREPTDTLGPFDLAAAVEKGEGKIVVISSRDCMLDEIALAPMMMLTSQGLTIRQRNPGNVQLFLNALHWLNDKTEWMDVGKPVNVGTLDIEEGPQLRFIRTLVYAIWPGLALLCGGITWWVRRR